MLEAAVDRLGRAIRGSGAVEVGQDVCGALLQGAPEGDDLGERAGDAGADRLVLRDQPMLLPVDLREWLPPDHLVWFVLDPVEALDTSALERTRRRGGVGAAGYDPRLLLFLLVYAYCQGVRSSRRIERMWRSGSCARRTPRTVPRSRGSAPRRLRCSWTCSPRCC